MIVMIILSSGVVTVQLEFYFQYGFSNKENICIYYYLSNFQFVFYISFLQCFVEFLSRKHISIAPCFYALSIILLMKPSLFTKIIMIHSDS